MRIFMHAMAFIVAVVSLSAHSRPVSYPSGITLMQMNDADSNTFHIHYSPTIHYSIGYKGEYWPDRAFTFQGLQLNWLAKRWNKAKSQANFYIKSGAGSVKSNDQRKFGSFFGISTDWENRRFFTMYENRYNSASNFRDFYTQKARFGIAPYLGSYGDLHTWLMLQVEHRSDGEDRVEVTPLVRLFKDEYLAEFGINSQGSALVNFVIRY